MRFPVRNWLWVTYPAAVAVFVVVSLSFMGSARSSLSQVTSFGEAAETESKIAVLREKLSLLSTVNVSQESEDLELFSKAVLPNKAIWLIVSEIKTAATEAGVTLVGYKAAGVGDVKEASESAELVENSGMALEVSLSGVTMESLASVLSSLERYLPLVSITKLNYQEGSAVLEVEGAWEPWVKLEGETPLPDFRTGVGEAKRRLEDFTSFAGSAEAVGESGDTTLNPF